ncbi:MAG: divergent PAP2 family protein [Bacilli bacterium]|nr:divergent PAP2 family protein [Bacilli bacterium]
MYQYIYLICPFITLILSQLIKFLIELHKNNKIDLSRLLNGNGGMPSCHASFSSSITMLIGFKLGFDNLTFIMGLIFTLIISYDAMSIRYQSELHAKTINKMLNESDNNYPKLREKIGHKPLEVLVGLIIGSFMAFIFSAI